MCSARASAPGSTKRSTWISKSRAQIVTSTPSPSPPAAASASATADSGVPKKRRTLWARLGARASTRCTGGVSSALGQSRWSSRGGPGRMTTTQRSRSRTSPGAVPARPREIEPSGRVACFRTPALKSSYGRRRRSAIIRETAPICSSSSGSSTSGRPATRATSSTVRSSCVGPRPPDTRQRSASNASRKAWSRSGMPSPTMKIDAGSRPSRTASAARNGPFRSCRSPRTSSDPVATMAARGRLKMVPERSFATSRRRSSRAGARPGSR